MTTEEIKDIIRERSKREVCEILHDVLNAADADAMLAAGIPLMEYAYRLGIVDDSLLTETTPEAAEEVGVYFTGTHTIDDPEETVFVFRDAEVTVNITNTRARVVCYTAGTTINVSGSGYIDLVADEGGQVELNISDDAIAKISASAQSQVVINASDNAICQINGTGHCQIGYVGEDDSYANVKMFQHSSFVYVLTGSATIDTVAINSAQIINSGV